MLLDRQGRGDEGQGGGQAKEEKARRRLDHSSDWVALGVEGLSVAIGLGRKRGGQYTLIMHVRG